MARHSRAVPAEFALVYAAGVDSKNTLRTDKAREQAAGKTPRILPAAARLLLKANVITPILLPTRLFIVGAKRMLLAIADSLDSVGTHALGDQRLTERTDATVAKSEVVFFRSPIIAVPSDDHLDACSVPPGALATRVSRTFRAV